MKNYSKINAPKRATSAGGVIVKKEENTYFVLLLRDTNFPEWYLAKGHVEAGETLEQAALREVQEEAGLHHVKIHKLLGSYERFVKKANEQKTIYYYLMSPTQEEIPSSPDKPSVELKWFALEHLPKMFLPEQKHVIEKNTEKIKSSLSSIT
jgi:8-oxo-dGTP pyrophosphatase MutT (NUDIX family)